MSRPPALRVIAGDRARAQIERDGLRPQDIRVMVGASGGPKWLALAKLDEHLFGDFFAGERAEPLHLIGSSAGAWRFACFAQANPAAASRRFAEAYQHICYAPGMGFEDITRHTHTLLDVVLPDDAAAKQVLTNPHIKLNLIAARARGLNAARARGLQAAGLGLTALANAVHRRALGGFFERVLFHAADHQPPFYQLSDLPTRQVALAENNLRPAILASGAIPLVLSGIPDIPGAGPGIYYDGGVTDYHFDIPFSQDGLVLYPHFYPTITPGWFDKGLKWRRANPRHYDNVVILCPSDDWVARLPQGRIPDRRDFTRMPDDVRIREWGEAMQRSEQLVEDFQRLASGDLSALRA